MPTNHPFPESTWEIGKTIGQAIQTSALIAMLGDLGSGKTVFVQGLAKGIDVPDSYPVTSPSYTLVNEYPGRLTLYHVDLYRLKGVSDFEDIGLPDIVSGYGVIAVEWAERLDPKLFTDHLSVQMEIIDDVSRKITLSAYGLEICNLIKSLRCSKK